MIRILPSTFELNSKSKNIDFGILDFKFRKKFLIFIENLQNSNFQIQIYVLWSKKTDIHTIPFQFHLESITLLLSSFLTSITDLNRKWSVPRAFEETLPFVEFKHTFWSGTRAFAACNKTFVRFSKKRTETFDKEDGRENFRDPVTPPGFHSCYVAISSP